MSADGQARNTAENRAAPDHSANESGAAQRQVADRLMAAITACANTPSCTDVVVNGTRLWADYGQGLVEQPWPDGLHNEDTRRLAIRLAAQADRRLDEACPIVDAPMACGWRLHAVIPPVAHPATLMSIRIPTRQRLELTDFIRFGWEPSIIDTIHALVIARANMLVSGGTGTGKTTLLAAALASAPHHERLVVIEETPELHITHPHCVHLHERAPNIQGAGAVPQAELVRAAMRMRPDRLILGECRGPEVREVMTALNTGHDGSWATIHANSPADIPARLCALGALAGMSDHAVSAQAAAAFDAVIHLGRDRDGQRHVRSISTVTRTAQTLICEAAVVRSREGALMRGPAWDALQRMLAPARGRTAFTEAGGE